jgi:hypothetical protein
MTVLFYRSEAGVGGDLYGVGFGDCAAGAVIYGCSNLRRYVLNEGAAAPDVEGLGALADGEDGFVEIEGVLDEELVYGGAVGVGAFALGDGGLAVFLGVDVGGAAGEEDSVAGGEDFGHALRGFVKRDGDGCGSGGIQRVEVLREGAQVVGFGVFDEAWTGGFGYGDVDRHDVPLRRL